MRDPLGSVRLVTDGTGNPVSTHDYLPFGEEIPAIWTMRGAVYGAADGVSQRFTGMERDSEAGLDFFGARYFSGAQGRFTSPDQPFNDQDASDPQSWNLFSYSRNNPLANTDPTGMFTCPDCGSGDDNGGEDNNSGGGSGLNFYWNLGANILQATGQLVQNQVQQTVSRTLNFLATRDPNCVLNAMGKGAVIGGTGGAFAWSQYGIFSGAVGTAGGPFFEIAVPLASVGGALGGGAISGIGGLFTCSSNTGGGGGGGGTQVWSGVNPKSETKS